MAGIPPRHRSLAVLALAIVAQLLLLAVQIKHDEQGRLLRVWTVGAISPFERVGSWTFQKLRGTWSGYFALRGAAKENEELRRELGELKLRVNQLESKAAEADRLSALLHFRQAHEHVPMLPARVIAASADTSSRTIYIDRGQRDGVKKDMGVITPDGVVGKVNEAFRGTSEVLLVTDRDSGVGAMLADSRIQSPVGGTGEPLLVLKYVANDDTVNPGERVVTSGTDRIFPKDLPLGTVTEIKPGNPFKQIRVRPAANLERLEEVLVLLTLHPLEIKPESDAAGPATQKMESAVAAKP